MTSWNRRLSAASGRPAVGERTSRQDVLAEAVAAGVIEDDQHALMAMANIARDRPGFHKTLDVQARLDNEVIVVEFEILHDEDGPIVRLCDTAEDDTGPAIDLIDDQVEDTSGGGVDIINILTDTLVETPDLVAIFASVGHEAVWANDAFSTTVEVRESDKIWFVELLDEWSKGHYEVKVLPALVKYGRWRGRLTLVTGGDATMAVSAVIVAHRDTRGEIDAISLVARDIAEISGGDGAGLVADSPFAALVEKSSDIIAVLTRDGIIEYASPAALRLLGQGEIVTGTDLLGLIHPDDRPIDVGALVRPDEQGIGAPVELRLQSADGSLRHLEVVVSDLTANQSIGGFVLNGRDVTERVMAVAALASRALTDALTDLPGRVRFLDRLATSLSATPAQPVVVLLIDLDRMQIVNEHLGRDGADEVLRQVAARLRTLMTPSTFVARVGSDEFAIVVDGAQPDDGVALAAAVRAAIAAPLPMTGGGGSFAITAAIGVSRTDSDQGVDPDSLLRNAEQALTHAKANGGDRIEVFTEEMAQLAIRGRTVEQTLRYALDHDGVAVHYQSIIDVADGKVAAAEALLRVHDEEGSLLSPAEFIEAAESSGLIARLGAQVLLSTCGQLAAWSLEPEGTVPSEISVNISPRQLADQRLPDYVIAALESSGVAPDRLWLEITESILIGAQPTIDASIAFLRELGVKIGLDDFGAGQSSLGYLKRFPLDFVKIDRTLVSGLLVNEHDTAIVRATIELAHNLGLTVVAVGVETDEQLDYLRLLGCDRAQGYYFAAPVPASQFTAKPA